MVVYAVNELLTLEEADAQLKKIGNTIPFVNLFYSRRIKFTLRLY